jgi:hypothetical protein
MLRRKSQGTPKTTTGRVFSAGLRLKTEDQLQPPVRQVPVASHVTVEPRAPALLLQQIQQLTDQSVRVPKVNSAPFNNVLRIVTVLQQIMLEFNAAV